MTNKRLSNLHANLVRHDWSFITDTSDINDDYDKFIAFVSQYINNNLPTKKILLKNDNKHKPWIMAGIRTSCKNKNKLYKLVCQNKYPKEQYVVYRNKLTSLICQSRINYYSCAFNKNVKKNSKMAWRLINNIIGKDVSSFSPSLYCNEVNKFSELRANAVNQML